MADAGSEPAGAGGLGWRWDVALSFAGAQREFAERVSAELGARGVRCFYDFDEQVEVELWGKHLAEHLPSVYGDQAAIVVLFVSAQYALKEWTRLERRAAFARAMQVNREYVLPVRFDGTPLPGLSPDVASIDLRTRPRSPEQVADLIARKLEALGITAPGLTAARAGTALPDSQDAAGSGLALKPGNPHHGTGERNTGAGTHEDRFAHEVTRELAPGRSRVFASVLGDVSWKEGAELSWAEIAAGVEGAGLAGNLTRWAGLSGNPVGVLDAIRESARMLPAERVAVLAVAVEGITDVDIADGLRNGYDTMLGTVLDTVAADRSADDIFGIADELDSRGHGRVAADLLGRAEQIVHLRADGADVAEFIDRVLTRDGERKPHGLFRRSRPGCVPVILENVARRRDPEQLMGMIAELTKRRRYGSCRRWVERGAAEYYGGSLLARLPLVLRRDYLPAVLEIAKTAFSTPKWTQPGRIPDIVLALRQADVTVKDLHALLAFAGGKRNLDYFEIAAALYKSDLHTEADWVIEGKRHPPREPHFLD